VSAGASSAAAAAAAARRQAMLRQEEEEMTGYSPQDLADDWEFKILRSATGAFKNPEKLRAVLDEEKRAGWVLVEKFDSGRLRLKRPASARQLDGKLDFDPYRNNVGTTEGTIALYVVLGVFTGLAVILGLLFIFLRASG
jgi:hypothetical protein